MSSKARRARPRTRAGAPSGECVICEARPNGRRPLGALGHTTAQHGGLVDLVNGMAAHCAECGPSMAKVIRIDASDGGASLEVYREGDSVSPDGTAGG